jgi:hypothetical protein
MAGKKTEQKKKNETRNRSRLANPRGRSEKCFLPKVATIIKPAFPESQYYEFRKLTIRVASQNCFGD